MNRNIHYIYIIAVLLLLGAATPALAQTIKGNVYGGGNLAQVVGSTTINVIDGTVSDQNVDDGNVYGGGYGASAILTGNTTINISGGTVTKDVYGGGALANVTGSTTVNVSGGIITQDVYGGGALANVSANTSVNLTGGALHDAYGGGLGSAGVAVYVNGNATTTLNGSKVTGSIFGANNVNGTPKGHVKVHVLSTASRGQANRNTTGTDESFDVMAVYGGGNKAAYIPTANDEKAEVLIENCDNSIAYVYGGGNAAPVPATDVKIYGANAIDNAFAAGNGAGAGNPGADIGYSDYTHDEGHKYGAGTASIIVYGGTVYNVFGGSNTLGYIADDAQVNIETQPDDYEGATCDLAITNLFGGGNKANGKAATIAIACTGNGKIDNVFGGANQANVEGDITLNITGGNIGNIFGGNNQSGVINGAIAVNINWGSDDCGIKHIDNVYGGGNLAPYKTPVGKSHPTITLTNGTVSHNIFGGGLGATAVMTGNPVVNINGGAVGGSVYGGGERADVVGSTYVTINDGRLGADIFGGGQGLLNIDGSVRESADVSGTTHVTINGGEFTVAYDELNFNEHYNIYGGGNIASQVGETHVYVTKGMVSNASDGSDSFLDNSRFDRNEAGMAQAYYHEGQMYFCIFGGGYGKNTSVTGDTWVDFNIDGMVDIKSTAIENDLLEYQSYLDVIGGGFNGIIGGNTNVHIGGNAMCRNVYGGGLYATIGNKGRGETGKTNVHITGGNIDNVYGGGVMGDIMTSTNVNIGLKSALDFDTHNYTANNDHIAILMSVYGANDVSGHVPTANIIHNGGEIDQNIYGAGNGNYRGYYTPNHCAYADGENDNYYEVTHAGDPANCGRTYKGRPQTDNVSITMGGNSAGDKAVVLGQVFGGGNSCTIGRWVTPTVGDKHDGDPHKWRDDPAYFLGDGTLNITLNSYVTIGQPNSSVTEDYKNEDGENVSGLFMGCSGDVLATQTLDPEDYNYHHYYDANTKKYWQGFAVYKDGGSTPMTREEGQKAFDAYLNNILMWSDDVNLNIANDAEDIWLANFVGGGFRGSMKRKTKTSFEWSLPAGVTVGNYVVGGAYNTDVVYRIYKTSDGHNYNTDSDGNYIYLTDVGTMTQGTDYDHIIYGATENVKGIARFMYAGGVLADIVLTLNNRMDGGVNAGVFGGCYSSGTVKNTRIDYRATGAYSVYGGGALANITGNSVVNLLGGSLTDAYGGGLGRLADIEKDYAPVVALVGGNATTTLTGSVVDGSIFGANNVNGTPQGHVKVHILHTTPREGQDILDPDQYDVAAVYGGGNQAAYIPSAATFAANNGYAEVLIENCDNSIEYVYGGGNAAPVPATDVIIYGADAIGNAFAGGNGLGVDEEGHEITDPEVPGYNPGADVGYNGYYSQTGVGTPTYGTGESHITIYGGTIKNVFGGSNTLGYIRTHAYVNVPEYEGDNKCELHLGDVHAGGNQADMFCGGSVTLGCSDGAQTLYAGSNDADIHGDIDLTISSGTYGQVFGGNNIGGNVYGHIKINIDETGCYPIMIGELYGCGNQAAYSVYGYDNEGNCIASGEKLYDDPVINIYSCTSIGKIFGGGYGTTAAVYGSPTININTIKGIFAGQAPRPLYVLDNHYNRITNDRFIPIPDEPGTIGDVYGGGNAAPVYGNTVVNIGTLEKNSHITGHDTKTKEDVYVTILGNVFGGSKGLSDDSNAGRVTGTTKVVIGK